MTRKQKLYYLKTKKNALRIMALFLTLGAIPVQYYVPLNFFLIGFYIYLFVFILLANFKFDFIFGDNVKSYRRYDRITVCIQLIYAGLINIIYWDTVVFIWKNIYVR